MMEDTSRGAGGQWEESLAVLRLVAPALDRAGVRFLVLKGPILASECYAHPGERPYTDLDILVSPRDRSRAIEALSHVGFTPRAGVAIRRFVEWGHFHLVLTPPAPLRLPVEAHWGLVDRANLLTIDLEQVLARARRVRLPGVTVSALDPVDDFLYLCVHLSRHGVMNGAALAAGSPATWFVRGESGNRLILFLDLLRVAARHGAALEPSVVHQRAVCWNAAATMRECLLLAEAVAGRAGALEPLARSAGSPSGTAGEERRSRAPAPVRLWAMRPLPGLVVRPVRLLELFGLFFRPSGDPQPLPDAIGCRDGCGCALHPLSMAARLLGGKG